MDLSCDFLAELRFCCRAESFSIRGLESIRQGPLTTEPFLRVQDFFIFCFYIKCLAV